MYINRLYSLLDNPSLCPPPLIHCMYCPMKDLWHAEFMLQTPIIKNSGMQLLKNVNRKFTSVNTDFLLNNQSDR